MFLEQVAKHLCHTYGNKAPEVAKLASITGSRWPVVGKRLVEQFPYIEAEIQYAVKEYACTIVDFLARRTRLAFLNAEAAADAIPRIAEIMAKELKWSKTKKEVNEMQWFTTVYVYATLENKTPAETLPKFPSVLRVIDRSDRNPPIAPP